MNKSTIHSIALSSRSELSTQEVYRPNAGIQHREDSVYLSIVFYGQLTTYLSRTIQTKRIYLLSKAALIKKVPFSLQEISYCFYDLNTR